jgi:hypothetical protein
MFLEDQNYVWLLMVIIMLEQDSIKYGTVEMMDLDLVLMLIY